MALPVPPDARAAKVVESIYSLFFARGAWPTFTELDRYLDMRGEPDAETVLAGLPAGIAYGVGMLPLHDDQEVALTVAGLAACAEATEDLDVFLRAIRHAAELEQEQMPGEPKPELISATIADRVSLPAAGTVADYWARTREETVGAAAPKSPEPDQAVRVRSWLELHREVPRLVIVNASEAEIRNVVPTVSLLAVDDDGEPSAMVGGAPIGRVAEISPGGAFVGELQHMQSWSKSSQVESTLHLEFDDARGQRWQLAHGAVIAIDKRQGGAARTAAGQLVEAQTLDLAQPISGFLSSNTERVAFISYVHEDRGAVDHLQRSLEVPDITVWRDLDQLLPGQSKRQKIVDAIRHQSFAFLCCFSAARAERDRTYANEELSVALEVLRTQNSAAWFIPVRFDDTAMPSLSLGHHGTLDDIIWVNLFGDGREAEMDRLLAALERLV